MRHESCDADPEYYTLLDLTKIKINAINAIGVNGVLKKFNNQYDENDLNFSVTNLPFGWIDFFDRETEMTISYPQEGLSITFYYREEYNRFIIEHETMKLDLVFFEYENIES